MTTTSMKHILAKFRSLRAGAINGIIFSIMIITVMFFVQDLITGSPNHINKEWLEKHSHTASLLLTLIPFIGISFLWFTGVLRDWLADQEDRFCSTAFLGSSILIVGLLFVWGAALGAMLNTYSAVKEGLVDVAAVYIFGHSFMNEILGDYTFRVVGVYMLSIATIWRQTRVMPRWIVLLTYFLAIVFLFFAAMMVETRFVFPCWVLLVSIYILIYEYRNPKKQEGPVSC